MNYYEASYFVYCFSYCTPLLHCPPLPQWCRIVHSCNVHPCHIVLICPLLQSPSLQHGAVLSTPAFSTPPFLTVPLCPLPQIPSTRESRLKPRTLVSFERKTITIMTSAVNVRSQLICVVFVFISLIIQCDGQSNNCGPGKVLDYEDFNSN